METRDFESRLERRAFTATELRAKNGSSPGIRGHAAVFNVLSEDLGGWFERVLPGAFADSITDGDIRALWNHDPNFPLARTKSGTLRLKEDDVGLAIDADLADATYARDLLKSIERGDVDQMSFGFMVLPDGSRWRMEQGSLIRELLKVELFDVSPVTFPAYPQTDVGARTMAELRTLAAEWRTKLGSAVADVAVEFQKRMQTRGEFIARRIPPPDPLDFREIINKCRIAG